MNEVPFVQSVLFKSPYSGCCKFSGWPPQTCNKNVGGTTWPSPYNRPGAILCVDRYQKTWKPPGMPDSPKYGPRATTTVMTPPYRLRAIAGPSSRGPFTYVQIEGICWGGQQTGYVRSGGTGQSGGLG